jgi:hypothetical protein
MTIAEFQKHLTEHGCKCNPLEGGNLSGIGLKLYNPANKGTYLLQLYRGGEISRTTVTEVCTMRLFIPLPKGY